MNVIPFTQQQSNDYRTGLQSPLPCRFLPHRFLAAPAAS